MTEILLRSNRRVGALVALQGLAALVLGGAFLPGRSLWVRVAAVALCAFGFVVLMLALRICLRPQLALLDNTLLVYLTDGAPFRIPIEAVEVFFIGQGQVSGNEPGHTEGYSGTVAANVIVRLAEAAIDWKHRDVNTALGVWRDGYITIRGLWCQNIDANVVTRMNRRLLEIKRAQRMERSDL